MVPVCTCLTANKFRIGSELAHMRTYLIKMITTTSSSRDVYTLLLSDPTRAFGAELTDDKVRQISFLAFFLDALTAFMLN